MALAAGGKDVILRAVPLGLQGFFVMPIQDFVLG